MEILLIALLVILAAPLVLPLVAAVLSIPGVICELILGMFKSK